MADSPQNPNVTPGKGLIKGKSNPGELLKTPSKSGDTLGNSGVNPETKIDFLLAPRVKGDLGSLGGFRIIKILGEGGMGLVFLAEDSSLNRKLAIKVILPVHANQTTKERFFREARATAALHHDNVISIFQVGEDNGVPFLAMPFLQGMPLDKYLAEQKKLPVKEALRITMEGLAGLSSAHARNMVHRDIKPSNIWLEGARKKVILLDFGLAKGGSVEDVSLTRVGAIMGTPAYMSPEQAQAKEVDRRADLFSMGVVLYEMLTAEGPFRGKTVMAVLANLMSKDPKPPCEMDPGIPKEVSDICMWMLEKDVEKRPNSARDVAARIQAFEKGKEKSIPVIELPEAPTPAKTLPPLSGKTLSPNPAKTLPPIQAGTIQGNPVKTPNLQWQPKNPEEFAKLYPEIESPRPRPSGEMPRKKKKKKKSSLVPVFMGLGGVLFFVVGLIFYLVRNEPISIHAPKYKAPIQVAVNKGQNGSEPNLKQFEEKESPATEQVNKGGDGSNDETGFENLFPDAEELDKWVNNFSGVLDKNSRAIDWSIAGEELRSSNKRGNWLISKKVYGDIILKFDLKLAPGADSGVLLRHNYNQNGFKEFELQLLRQRASDVVSPIFQNGAIGDLIPPQNKVLLDREWNQIWIKFEGTHFEARINQHLVQDLDYASKNDEIGAFKKLINRPLKGHMGFQCYTSGGEPIIFRNVRIKELNQTQTPNTQAQKEEEERYLKEIANQEELVKANPGNSKHEADLGRSHHNLGRLFLNANRLNEAEESNQKALAIRKALVNVNPTNLGYQAELARSHNNLGVVFNRTNRQKEAETSYLTALGIQEGLVKSKPLVLAYQADLALSHSNLGILYNKTNRQKEAEVSYLKSLGICEFLVKTNPTNSGYQADLTRTKNNFANLRNRQAWEIVSLQDKGLEQYKNGLRLAQEGVILNPKNGIILNTLGVAQYRVKQFPAALETLQKSNQLNSKTSGKEIPADLAFLSMACYQLNNKTEAEIYFQKLQEAMKEIKNSENQEYQGFLKEAEALLKK